MKTGTLICYTLGSKPTAVERNRFRKEFWGYRDFSNKGRYTYERDGLISDVPHVKLIRSVIIVRNEDCDRIVEFLRKNNATVFMKKVILSKEDQDKLKINE